MVSESPAGAGGGGAPVISVIVPARNEETSLGACLRSLVSQTGIEQEIIVVDDASTDRTREIAQSFAGVRLIEAAPLQPGSTGKCNALVCGARQARGKWFLFTDADTVHLPGSLAASLQEAQEHQAALLSYSPRQEVHGFWEKAVMPVIFAELTRVYRSGEVNDPAAPAAAANGQYLLISREAYDAVGGHAAVMRSLLEDVELARAVKRSGRRIYFRYGGDRVCARMYRSFAQLREGWTKNLALLFESPRRLALMRGSEFIVIVGGAAVTIVAATRLQPAAAVVAGGVVSAGYLLFLRRIRRAHFGWDANLLALLGLPVFVSLLLGSQLSHRQGSVTWKGRTYGAASSATNSAAAGRSSGFPADAPISDAAAPGRI
ncbi:MAG TPA: glycosyltransferase family 2 protein [Terriglobales bacterium]|jgi:molybdopterin-guanine dinucleotide biosynthesis protein A|nr:glycosyltransferase family 2 protein [Terriglobales bacterium]